MIRVSSLTHHYGVRPVLRNIDLEVGRGELLAVVGPNGMGKSTLLSAIAGVLSPRKGTVEIAGLLRRGSVEDELAIRKQVVYLPADAWLPRNNTARDFILAVGRLYEIEDERLMDHVDRLLQLFELAGDRAISSLSTGQQKKVALCSALVAETPVLLLDEPFSGGLDPSGIMALKRVLQRLVRDAQATVIITTPIPELVEEVADRIAILSDGKVVACDSLEGLRRKTGAASSLAEVLELMLHPQTLDNLERYYAGMDA